VLRMDLGGSFLSRIMVPYESAVHFHPKPKTCFSHIVEQKNNYSNSFLYSPYPLPYSSSSGIKSNAVEFMQYRFLVGSGPS